MSFNWQHVYLRSWDYAIQLALKAACGRIPSNLYASIVLRKGRKPITNISYILSSACSVLHHELTVKQLSVFVCTFFREMDRINGFLINNADALKNSTFEMDVPQLVLPDEQPDIQPTVQTVEEPSAEVPEIENVTDPVAESSSTQTEQENAQDMTVSLSGDPPLSQASCSSTNTGEATIAEQPIASVSKSSKRRQKRSKKAAQADSSSISGCSAPTPKKSCHTADPASSDSDEAPTLVPIQDRVDFREDKYGWIRKVSKTPCLYEPIYDGEETGIIEEFMNLGFPPGIPRALYSAWWSGAHPAKLHPINFTRITETDFLTWVLEDLKRIEGDARAVSEYLDSYFKR